MKSSQNTKPIIAYMLGTFPALTETFILREIQALLRNGFEVLIYAIKRPDNLNIERSLSNQELLSLCTYARPDNIFTHIICNISCFFKHPLRYLSSIVIILFQIGNLEPVTFMRLLYHFFCGIGFTSKMRKDGINHIHCHFTSGCNIGLIASLYLGLPFSWTAHASGDIFVKPILLEVKLKYARFVIAVSEYSKKYLDSVTDLKYSDKIYKIYNGIDILEPEKLSNLNLFVLNNIRPEDKIRIISIGSLFPYKGFTTLIEACKILKNRGHNIVCEIVGDGPHKNLLLGLTNKWELESEIKLLGYQPLNKIYQLLNRGDIFTLLPEIYINGYRDGLPTVIMEAMIMSLPVVSTWISAIPEMVVEGKTGFLVPERDANKAADALEKLIINKEKRVIFGKRGKQRAMNLFDLNKNIGKVINHYHNIFDKD
jgi:colanic acid/amylovoran biosynthesis glycosyltransferase